MQTQCLRALPAVRPLGRHTCTDGALNLFYTASGFVCRFTGSELRLCLNAGFTLYEPWLSVEVNGAWVARFPVAAGESEVCLLRGMTPGVPKTVRVVKDVQPCPATPATFCRCARCAMTAAGFCRCRNRRTGWNYRRQHHQRRRDCRRRGGAGLGQYVFWRAAPLCPPDRRRAERRLAHRQPERLGAFGSSWDNDPHCRVLDHYDTVCGVAAGAPHAALGAQQPYDFAAWPADAVILNLGTNDEHALDNPPWTDPATGDAFAQRPTPLHLAALEQAAVDALKTVARAQPARAAGMGLRYAGAGAHGPAAAQRRGPLCGRDRRRARGLPAAARRHGRNAGFPPAPRPRLPPPGRRNADGLFAGAPAPLSFLPKTSSQVRPPGNCWGPDVPHDKGVFVCRSTACFFCFAFCPSCWRCTASSPRGGGNTF